MCKKIILLILLLNGLTIFCKAQDSSKVQPATVYFIRSTGVWGLGPFSAFIDDSLACHLHNNRFSIHFVSPGLHKLQARVEGNKPRKKLQTLDIPMEAGHTYYITMDVMDNNSFYGKLSLIEITKNSAKKMLAPLKEESNCN